MKFLFIFLIKFFFKDINGVFFKFIYKTILHLAIEAGNIEIVETILSFNKFDINSKYVFNFF